MFTRRLVLTGLGATSIAALVPGALRAAPIKPNEASALLVIDVRSEEHTSELQSQSNLVCRLLLEKKKTGLNSSHSQIWYAVVGLKKKTELALRARVVGDVQEGARCGRLGDGVLRSGTPGVTVDAS